MKYTGKAADDGAACGNIQQYPGLNLRIVVDHIQRGTQQYSNCGEHYTSFRHIFHFYKIFQNAINF